MTLERILEDEVMDSDEEARDYDQMDHGEVNRLFVSDLIEAGEVAGDILDLGTGTAQIPVELCGQMDAQEDADVEFRILAVDLSPNMLDLARYNIEVACVIEKVFLGQVDAKDMPYEDDMFDMVMSNSIVHHIPNPEVAIRESVRIVRDGGRLFFRDLLRPDSAETLQQLVAISGQVKTRRL